MTRTRTLPEDLTDAGERAAPQPRLHVVPCSFDEACAFVAQHHRHHLPPVGHKFSIAVADEAGEVRGVCIVGRPINNHLDDGWTLEVTRVATDGCPNACSALYGAAWRVVKGLGYRRLVTYILKTEPGTSLKAVGWRWIGDVKGKSWSHASRPRIDKHSIQDRMRWEVS